MNCANVIVPSPTHVPGPAAALNVVGSHLSIIRTAMDSLAIRTIEDAMATITSDAAKNNLARFMNFPFLSQTQNRISSRESCAELTALRAPPGPLQLARSRAPTP